MYAYDFHVPSPVSSVIRGIDDISPVKGTDNKYLACGQNAQKAARVASAQPGSTVSFKWVNIAGGNVRLPLSSPSSASPIVRYIHYLLPLL